MHLSLMRQVDYYIGIPVCFFLSRLYSLSQWFTSNKKQQSSKISNILIIQLSEMGSTVLAYPLLKKLQKKYPESTLYFLIFKKNKICLDILNVIPENHIYTINTDGLLSFVKDTVGSILKLRKLNIDCVIDLELFSRFSAAISYLSGAKKRAGYFRFHMEGLYRGNFLTHRIMYNFHYHISKNFLSFLQVIDQPMHLVPALSEIDYIEDMELPRALVSSENKNALLKKINSLSSVAIKTSTSFILLYVSGGILPIRSWPKKYFVELANKISEIPNTLIILIGDNHAVEESNEVFKSLAHPSRCINLSGHTSLQELIALYQLSTILITNDGGPAHFATLTPHLNTFIFYGPESPNLYKPLGKNIHFFYNHLPCSPCLTAFNHRHSSCEKNSCLESILPDTVFSHIVKSTRIQKYEAEPRI